METGFVFSDPYYTPETPTGCQKTPERTGVYVTSHRTGGRLAPRVANERTTSTPLRFLRRLPSPHPLSPSLPSLLASTGGVTDLAPDSGDRPPLLLPLRLLVFGTDNSLKRRCSSRRPTFHDLSLEWVVGRTAGRHCNYVP